MPLAGLITLALALSGQRKALWCWLLSMGLGTALVLMTKMAFMGWGIGSAELNFTGISGHATLATSILPVALALVLSRTHARARQWGLILGLTFGALVSWSRVMVGAHSISEVIAGFSLGAVMSIAAARFLHPPTNKTLAWLPALGMAAMLFFHEALPSRVPTHHWEERLAMKLSGRSMPYSREMLLSRQESTLSL